MNVEQQIHQYLASQPDPKRGELEELHGMIVEIMPQSRLWFLDGKDGNNKVVSNPSIGYGVHTIQYADGKTREFYRIGLSANKSGISVYIFGIKDKTFLARAFGTTLGKASVTGYCIKFRSLKEIKIGVLLAAIRHGFGAGDELRQERAELR